MSLERVEEAYYLLDEIERLLKRNKENIHFFITFKINYLSFSNFEYTTHTFYSTVLRVFNGRICLGESIEYDEKLVKILMDENFRNFVKKYLNNIRLEEIWFFPRAEIITRDEKLYDLFAGMKLVFTFRKTYQGKINEIPISYMLLKVKVEEGKVEVEKLKLIYEKEIKKLLFNIPELTLSPLNFDIFRNKSIFNVVFYTQPAVVDMIRAVYERIKFSVENDVKMMKLIMMMKRNLSLLDIDVDIYL